jgi:hypothetical protein
VLTDAIDAVVHLNLQPRQRRWTSLAYCVLDAVWSIGARYDTVVVPLAPPDRCPCPLCWPSSRAQTPSCPAPMRSAPRRRATTLRPTSVNGQSVRPSVSPALRGA